MTYDQLSTTTDHPQGMWVDLMSDRRLTGLPKHP